MHLGLEFTFIMSDSCTTVYAQSVYAGVIRIFYFAVFFTVSFALLVAANCGCIKRR